jgi:hypothetical protein
MAPVLWCQEPPAAPVLRIEVNPASCGAEFLYTYLGDPGRRTHIRFRRERARQLRGLLSEPEAVDLHNFNHEMWVLSSGAHLRGEALDLALFEDAAVLGET